MNEIFLEMTGGASGIGAETVRVLALRGAHVVIAARNVETAEEVKKKIVLDNSLARISVMKLDLSSLKSVAAFAHEFNSLALPLNLLMYSSLQYFSCLQCMHVLHENHFIVCQCELS